MVNNINYNKIMNNVHYDLVIVDYPDLLGNSFQSFDKEKADKITEMGKDILRRNVQSFIMDYYKIDKLILDKFVEIYGVNPSGESMFDHPDDNDKNIQRDKQRLMNITRALKINRIRKCI